ncbi:MAG: hypothetical protein RLZZ15_1497 [Verrucomicrobiota bacterium]|jgi:hypothetical protein
MPQNPHAQFDDTVLDLIEHHPHGVVPNTPSYQDALERLRHSHQIYAHADHKGGHVTTRSLARQPVFHAQNLAAVTAGTVAPEALEPNASIFDRYAHSLPLDLIKRAEALRLHVAGRPAHHRKHGGVVAHDPVHTLFLVPGAGPNVGLPGNYLHGSVLQLSLAADSGWAVHLHDSDDGAAEFDAPTMAAALEKLQELIASAPFHLSEIEALGFRLK